MGADMIVTVLAAHPDTKLDFDAGRAFIDQMELTSGMVDEFFDLPGFQIDELDHATEAGEWDLDKVRAYLRKTVDTLEEVIYGRYCAEVMVRGLSLFIAGGLSHGDLPEDCAPMDVAQQIEGLEEAIGFIPGYHEPEHPPIVQRAATCFLHSEDPEDLDLGELADALGVDRANVEALSEPDGAPCCADPDCGGNPCTFPGYADNH